MLFIINSIELGGVETYALRLAKEFYYKKSTKLVLLVLSRRTNSNYLYKELHHYCEVIYYDELSNCPLRFTSPRLNTLLPLSASRVLLKLKGIDHIHAIDEISLVLANRINCILPELSISVGVYHSKLFVWEDNSCSYVIKFARSLFANVLPKKNIFYFNNASKTIAKKYFSDNFDGAPVFPLGVISNHSPKVENIPKFGKIVSIGRLVDFKTYNENLIKLLPELRKQGEYEYHVYGDGPRKQYLEQLASNLGVDDIVTFHGSIDYNNFSSTLSDCWCFVGSGTALVEAANQRVLSIIGTESSDKTSGFFHEIQDFDYNEKIDSEKKYIDLILNIELLDREKCNDALKDKAQRFSIDNNIKYFNDVVKVNPISMSYARYVISTIYNICHSRFFGNKGSRLD